MFKKLFIRGCKFFTYSIWFLGLTSSYLTTITACFLSLGFSDIESLEELFIMKFAYCFFFAIAFAFPATIWYVSRKYLDKKIRLK